MICNKSVAEVYVRGSPQNQSSQHTSNFSECKYYFKIGSVETFEKNLEDAQKALGIDPHSYVPVSYVEDSPWMYAIVPVGILLFSVFLIVYKRILGKPHFTKIDKNAKNKVYLKDVSCCEEGKQEIMEFVHFLKNPNKYEKLGAKIPKGALLLGLPGTAKMLLAKATAGECGVPLLSTSGD